jgi:hypothetical protein
MNHAAEFRRCLEELDVKGIQKLWKHVQPNLPQPKNDRDALIALHMARTATESVPFKLRAYSHRFLVDGGLPSQLPDILKPKAERLYPVVFESVGISVNARSELLKPIVPHVRGAMELAVLEAYADGERNPTFVKARMMEARQKEIKRLLGKLSG